MERITRIFRAQLTELDKMMQWARDILDKSSLSAGEAKKFVLAIEEAVINIVQYAYPHPTGLIEITCEMDPSRGEVNFIFLDQGIPFNPLKQDYGPKNGIPMEELEAGGLGIHFIVQMTDQVTYKREGDSNILRLTKSVSTKS